MGDPAKAEPGLQVVACQGQRKESELRTKASANGEDHKFKAVSALVGCYCYFNNCCGHLAGYGCPDCVRKVLEEMGTNSFAHLLMSVLSALIRKVILFKFMRSLLELSKVTYYIPVLHLGKSPNRCCTWSVTQVHDLLHQILLICYGILAYISQQIEENVKPFPVQLQYVLFLGNTV